MEPEEEDLASDWPENCVALGRTAERKVQFVPDHQNKLLSASVDGLMCIFDARGSINDDDHLESVPNPRIITACLEELENIPKVGEVEKNLDNSMNVNYYARLIHETERFEKIENLQSLDDDEIYGKWVEILLGHKNAATVSQETSVQVP